MRTVQEQKAFDDGMRAAQQRQNAELVELRAIKAAVANLIKQKGHHNTQVAYERLVALMQESNDPNPLKRMGF